MFKRVLWWYLFVGWGVCCLKGLPYARLKATSTPSHAIRSYKVQTNAFQGEIPYEISSVDQYPLVPTELLLPDTSIATLYGADNLGVILWTFVLYNGLYITRQRPVDILIPLIAKVIQQEHLQWYQDYKDGYASQKPPLVDFVTYAFFTTTGYFINTVVINSLDGDSFWGWSIAACLGIPSALFTLAKSKKQTREEALLNVSIYTTHLLLEGKTYSVTLFGHVLYRANLKRSSTSLQLADCAECRAEKCSRTCSSTPFADTTRLQDLRRYDHHHWMPSDAIII